MCSPLDYEMHLSKIETFVLLFTFILSIKGKEEEDKEKRRLNMVLIVKSVYGTDLKMGFKI